MNQTIDLNQKDLTIDLETAIEIINQSVEQITFLDVRTPIEYQMGHIPNAQLYPMELIQAGERKGLRKDQLIIVYCRSGRRTKNVQTILQDEGYRVVDAGGILNYHGKVIKD